MNPSFAPKIMDILLVEDDEVDVEAVRRMLRKNNILNTVYEARDGVEALEMLTERHAGATPLQPCVMLVDINMPRMNGLQLLEAVRGDERLRDNIVFILTTSSREEDRAKARDLSAAGYVTKENLAQMAPMLAPYCGGQPAG